MAQEFIDITTGSVYYYSSSYSLPSGSHKLLNFNSVKHLYYSNYNTGSGIIETSGSYYNYVESSISSSRRMQLSGEGIAYSIPKSLYGTHLEPNTIRVVSGSYTLTDDGEGNLFYGDTQVGNVIYSHGMIIVNSNTSSLAREDVESISFKSNLPIYTHNYNIKISDYEFNHTLNPTAQVGSTILSYSGSVYLQPSGKYADNVTGSAFQPYITAIGLYNDSNELIAVGKLAQPLPKPADTELTIQVKLDV
jgi:ribosomal protein L30E